MELIGKIKDYCYFLCVDHFCLKISCVKVNKNGDDNVKDCKCYNSCCVIVVGESTDYLTHAKIQQYM